MSRSIHSKEHRALVEQLIAARKSVGLTQHELAARLDRPQSYVAKYEGGERRVDVVEFVQIARALNTDPAELFASFIEASR